MARAFPALILTGARQTGKTSLVRRLFPDYRYVSLDLRILAEQAEEAPESFLADHPPPVIIDEVQYAPGLFRHLKAVIDSERHVKGRFILTGSQKFTLMREVSDSLAGRSALLNLPGLNVREMQTAGWDSRAAGAQYRLLTRGWFPELWAEPSLPSREYYQAYVATYLERDLRQMLNVGSLRDFERFMRACAARAGQLLNKSELARDVGISHSTAGEWLSALEASNQIRLLEPFFANIGKRLVKTPKLYFCDTGLLAFLLGLPADALGNSALAGRVWENFICAEIAQWLDLNHPEWSLWFYRDQQNREADFLIQGPFDRIRLLDAKWSEMPRADAFAPLAAVSTQLAGLAGVSRTDITLVGRGEGVRKLGGNRFLVSGFELARHLAEDAAGIQDENARKG